MLISLLLKKNYLIVLEKWQKEKQWSGNKTLLWSSWLGHIWNMSKSSSWPWKHCSQKSKHVPSGFYHNYGYAHNKPLTVLFLENKDFTLYHTICIQCPFTKLLSFWFNSSFRIMQYFMLLNSPKYHRIKARNSGVIC